MGFYQQVVKELLVKFEEKYISSPPTFNNEKEKFILVLCIMTSRIVSDIRSRNNPTLTTFHIKRDTWYRLIGKKDYSKYLHWLRDVGLIVQSRSYISEALSSVLGIEPRSKAYGIPQLTQTAEIINYRFSNVWILKRLLSSGFVESFSLKEEVSENLKKIRVDSNTAESIITGEWLVRSANGDTSPEVDRAFEIELQSMTRLASDPSWYVKQCAGGRIHTPFTNLRKTVRESCLWYNSWKMESVDIRSSQVAFLCSMLKKECRTDDQKTEISDLEQLVASGIYEWVSERFGVDRERSKKMVITYLFDRNWRTRLTRMGKLFMERFPQLDKMMRDIKDGNHPELAIRLQREESGFVFTKLVPAVKKIIGDVPWFTVHDSIAVPSNLIGLVKNCANQLLTVNGIPTIAR